MVSNKLSVNDGVQETPSFVTVYYMSPAQEISLSVGSVYTDTQQEGPHFSILILQERPLSRKGICIGSNLRFL